SGSDQMTSRQGNYEPANMPLKRRLRSADGCELATYEGGNPDGLPLVFLHGFSLDHSVWSRLWAEPQLASTCRLIAIDLRGHGQSSAPPTMEAYVDGSRWADDLACVIDELNVINAVVVAWSYGGRILNDYLRHYGQDQIVGINFVAAATINDPTLIGADHALLGAMCSPETEEANLGVRHFVEQVFGYQAGSSEHARLTAIVNTVDSQTRLWLRQRALDYDTLLGSITIPVLISHGARDQFVLPELAVRLNSVLSNGRIILHEGSGHAPFFDDPRSFSKALLRFATECNGGRLGISRGL
ncbi:alpha/beta fold hydrolase, partial [Paraburkholderia sp. RL18-085-BIA-A]|uniref:alpha/beta fold hydrolase n=1 Tax=Paraburkholderia sp. RL18-085-BIA-A TaxID=3031633 RepID=UPI0038BD2004